MRYVILAIVLLVSWPVNAQSAAATESGQWWDALKYGSIGVISLITLWTAGLLTIELRRETVRDPARRLIGMFMAFCLVIAAFSIGITVFDKVMAGSQDEKLNALKASAEQINSTLGDKRAAELMSGVEIDDRTRQLLDRYMRTICENLKKMYLAGGWGNPGCVIDYGP